MMKTSAASSEKKKQETTTIRKAGFPESTCLEILTRVPPGLTSSKPNGEKKKKQSASPVQMSGRNLKKKKRKLSDVSKRCLEKLETWRERSQNSTCTSKFPLKRVRSFSHQTLRTRRPSTRRGGFSGTIHAMAQDNSSITERIKRGHLDRRRVDVLLGGETR